MFGFYKTFSRFGVFGLKYIIIYIKRGTQHNITRKKAPRKQIAIYQTRFLLFTYLLDISNFLFDISKKNGRNFHLESY